MASVGWLKEAVAQLRDQGYTVLRKLLSVEELEALQLECSVMMEHARAACDVDSSAGEPAHAWATRRGCILQVMPNLASDAPERRDAAVYLRSRSSQAPYAAAVSGLLVSRQLLELLQAALGSRRVYLYNEQYIVKPANSGAAGAFEWHRDAWGTAHPKRPEQTQRVAGELQSGAASGPASTCDASGLGDCNCSMGHLQCCSGPGSSPLPACLSLWIALDDADAANGALSVLPGSHKQLLPAPPPGRTATPIDSHKTSAAAADTNGHLHTVCRSHSQPVFMPHAGCAAALIRSYKQQQKAPSPAAPLGSCEQQQAAPSSACVAAFHSAQPQLPVGTVQQPPGGPACRQQGDGIWDGPLLLEVHAGDAVLFSHQLLHCSGANSTRHDRRAWMPQFSAAPITSGKPCSCGGCSSRGGPLVGLAVPLHDA